MIVPVTAGSAIDITARTVSDQLARQLAQTFVVENRTGAGGTTGATAVAKADPDGYTVLVHSSAVTIHPVHQPRLRYGARFRWRDADRQCAAHSGGVAGQVPLARRADCGKAENESGMNYASVGYGAAAHLTSSACAAPPASRPSISPSAVRPRR